MAINQGKYANGSGSSFKVLAKGENGISIPISIMSEVSATTGFVAQLWIKGIFLVLIMCTISVCDSKPSINQPLWKSVWCAGLLALKTKNITPNMA